MPYVQFLLCALVWSASFILMKKATLGFTPISVGMWRCVWGAAVLAVLCWRRNLIRAPARHHLPHLAIVTLIGGAWPYAIQPLVVARQGSAFMALAVAFLPLSTIVVSIPLLRVWPTTRQIVGVCGALICLGLLLADGLARNIPLSDFGLALSVPIGYAFANTIIRGWLQDLPAPTLTLYLLAITAVILLPMRAPDAASTASRQIWWQAWLALAVLGVLGTGLATFWFNQLVQDHGPLFAGMITNLVPVGAVLWGWADNEQVSTRQVIALAGIVAMVAMVQFGAAKGHVIEHQATPE